MSGKKPRDMTGTARCGDCGAIAVHERGPGTPLVIHHLPGCPADPSNPGAQGVCWEYQAGELPIRLSFSIKVF